MNGNVKQRYGAKTNGLTDRWIMLSMWQEGSQESWFMYKGTEIIWN
jgi:hypothetical protein